jgi:hypothetical protein
MRDGEVGVWWADGREGESYNSVSMFGFFLQDV